MNTLTVRTPSGLIKRLVGAIGVAIAISASAASAADESLIYMPFGNKIFGDSKDLKVTSGAKTLFASEGYDYVINARCKGEKGTIAERFCPPNTTLETLIEKIKPGGSVFLKGSYDNSATGTLPTPVFKKTFAGVRRIKGVGKVDLSVTLLGKVLANGTCVLEVKNVKFRTLAGEPLGTIMFMKGSNVTFSVKPMITFHSASKLVSEGTSTGVVSVPVYRDQNFRDAYSVNFATADGSATSSNYVPVSGTLNFAHGEVKKFIDVTIINDVVGNPTRDFRINLSNPTNGAYLGPIPSIRVDIIDND